MRYKIPRYIDYEAKIFGPASFKQFLFLLAGMITIGFLWLIIDNLFIFFLTAALVGGIFGGLAFGKINGQPIVSMLGKFIAFKISGEKRYFWKKKDLAPKTIKRREIKEEETDQDNTRLPTKQKKGKLDKMSKKIETS
ncbi:MAG: PrgI family protein [Patescibacteria group bacterium]